MSAAPAPPAPIGFVGIGNMGRPMAAMIAAAGYELRVFDRNLEATRGFATEHGGVVAPSLKALARASSTVITMLPASNIVHDVVLGPEGLADGLAPGSLVIDMSSSDPTATREIGLKLKERGIAFIDAPVSGGVKRALDGSLSAMVGGDAELIERAMPLLRTMAKDIFLTGPLGSGHAMKALNNMVSAAGLWIAAEAVRVGGAFGLEPETIVDILNASTGRNNSTENKLKQHILSRRFASGFSLGLMAKDLRSAAMLADATHIGAPLSQYCAKLWGSAADELGGAQDHTAIVKFLERHREGEASPSSVEAEGKR
jgi:3-hydroxyisobutyrate dehydrogenase